ncbi:MAG: lycopene beta-cyclase CrtY [Hyphomicrobiaceae bacterium]|nr:lycopene beta-cyclase CrtY [Hyphomicrobiaceae bacterium]
MTDRVGPAAGDADAQSHADVVLVGAGLANALIALALRRWRPDASVRLIERAPRLGGNHTWSFHSSDITAEEHEFIGPLTVARWPSQEVWFPAHRRHLRTGYNSVTSERMAAAVTKALPAEAIVTGADVVELGPDAVRLADGRTFSGRAIIDGRGAVKGDALRLGYQKFVGLEVEVSAPHGRSTPIIMDATVEQIDGYRFVYTLPFSPTRILVEDTYYSDTPDLEVATLAERCRAYAAAKGWTITRVEREEQGVLPITLAGDIEAFLAQGQANVARSGMRAGLFHPTTGYSLPDAAHLAVAIARAPRLTTSAVAGLVAAQSRRVWRERSFFRLLNRMLMIAAQGAERRDVLERFYTLPESLIERFYAGRLTQADKLRILMGRPPLPIGRAIGQLSEAQAFAGRARSEPHSMAAR